jgi:phosphatidate cytidylyltransferase
MFGTVLILILFLLVARDHQDRTGWIMLGIPYMASSGLALLYLRAIPDIGGGLMFYLVAVVGSTDIGAYLAGRLIGGPKLIPAISPNKTWAGLCGGMLLAAVVGSSVAAGLGAKHIGVAAWLALLLACVSQLGDVFESFFKRRSGVKESGGLIPGHGGILDRIDGLVFAGVFFVLFQASIGAVLQWW